MKDLERYIFVFSAMEQYEVDENIEVIKRELKSTRNGTVACPLENLRKIVALHLGGIRKNVVGENLHNPVYTLPVEYDAGRRTVKSFVHVYEVRNGVGVKNEKTKI